MRGVPFLTQALGGRYRDVRLSATGVPAGDVRLAALDARLQGVRVPLRAALSGSVDAVPVERVDARALLSYDALARRAGDRALTFAPDGDRLRVRGSVRVLGREVSAVAVSRVVLDGERVVVTAEEYEVGNGLADAALTRALRGRFDVVVPLGGLPYGLAVEGLEVRPDGLAVRAVARDTVLAPQ